LGGIQEKAVSKLLVATRNPGKAQEFKRLLRGIPFQITSLDEEGVAEEVEETGHTFEDNARLKARTYAELTGLLTLADDSGLEVDALGGEPGVKSARYGGLGLTDEDRVELLLRNLKDVPWEDRTGRFRCVIAVVRPTGEAETVTGAVEGVIQYSPKGSNGFGYDPVFYLPHLGKTTAELSLEEKNGISHRGQAARKAVELLKELAVHEP
jgi:XTP/dITP diphosphohydrolase